VIVLPKVLTAMFPGAHSEIKKIAMETINKVIIRKIIRRVKNLTMSFLLSSLPTPFFEEQRQTFDELFLRGAMQSRSRVREVGVKRVHIDPLIVYITF
jgi:hypothetical protein